MQGVQIAQNAADLAQSSYTAAVQKQAQTAKAMAEVEMRLKSLQEKGKTLVSPRTSRLGGFQLIVTSRTRSRRSSKIASPFS